MVYSSFPSPLYLPARLQQGAWQRRLRLFLEGGCHTAEFYTLEGLLNFVFSPISPYTQADKLAVLDGYLGLFSENYRNSLTFFSQHSHQATGLVQPFADVELIPSQNLLLFPAPVLAHDFIEIHNAKLGQALLKTVTDKPACCMVGNHKAVALLHCLRQVVKREAVPSVDALRGFYTQCEESLQRMLRECLPVLFS